MENINKRIEELLSKLGKTKEDLARELENLNQYIESQDHGYLDQLSLERMFSVKQDFENKMEDARCHAEYLGYQLSDDELARIVRRFEAKYDCDIDENSQWDILINIYVNTIGNFKNINKADKYKLVSYISVYEDESNNYIVNDSIICKTGITICDDVTDEEIIGYLKKIDFLNEKATTENIKLDGDDYFIEIEERKNGYPLGKLVRE
ncbi:MAG TPA: hypothetical protein DCW90_03625 [Lachnospiraceae bacterium]|nr:hypothetical protein [Lachnospiraceae bacterium]